MYQLINNFTASSRPRANSSLEMWPSSLYKFSQNCKIKRLVLTLLAKKAADAAARANTAAPQRLGRMFAVSAGICLEVLLDQHKNINQTGSNTLGCKSHCVRRRNDNGVGA
jgi:hypothetical protein|tara:strand:+ start:195 stop:527 length:333 start_codon:yes stop_codon:yes gene_type:complete